MIDNRIETLELENKMLRNSNRLLQVELDKRKPCEEIKEQLQKAKELGAKTIAFTGEKENELEKSVDICLKVPSDNTGKIQEAHLVIGHLICKYVELALK